MEKLKVGVIPDGNRHWARKNHRSWGEAYVQGAEVAVQLIREMLLCGDVERAVFFALAEENLKLRSPEQVRGILAGVERFFVLAKGLPIKVSCHGNSTPPEVVRLWPKEGTFSFIPEMQIDLLLNYSAAWDLEARPIRTVSIPPLDLVVRTSASAKLSGFLPWQSAYAKLFFSETLWPDFTISEFREILDCYKKSGKSVSGA